MRKIIRLPILLLIVLLLTGCSGKKEMQQTQESSGTKIYYIDSKTSKIVSEDYNLEATTIVGKINELLEALRKPPENMLYKNALPEEISIKKTTFTEDGRLTINFDTNYSSLTGIPEVLGRATIVKTLCQISEVEYIEFYVNDQPLMDSNGVVDH